MIVAVGWLVRKIYKRFFIKSSIATSPNDDAYILYYDRDFPEELFNREGTRDNNNGNVDNTEDTTTN